MCPVGSCGSTGGRAGGRGGGGGGTRGGGRGGRPPPERPGGARRCVARERDVPIAGRVAGGRWWRVEGRPAGALGECLDLGEVDEAAVDEDGPGRSIVAALELARDGGEGGLGG